MICGDEPDHGHGHNESHVRSDACASLYLSWLVKPIDIARVLRFLASDTRMRAMIDAQLGTALP